jgi:hypothetical protein
MEEIVLNDRQIEELIRIYRNKSQRPVRAQKFSQYSKDQASERLTALRELKKLRAGIPCEGMVS